LAFLMTGPATNAATIAVLWRIMGRRTVVIYLATVALCALTFGFLLDRIFTMSGIAATGVMSHMLPPLVKTVAAVALLAILAAALMRRPAGGAATETATADEPGTTATLSISGMTCNHCAMSVQRALRECSGVSSVDVDLRHGTADVTGTDFDLGSLSNAVEGLGYKVRVV